MAASPRQSSYLSLPKSHARSRRSSASVSDRSDTTDRSGNSSDKSNDPRDDIKPTPRRRACRPKVRTGCITCKSRHVKCDEGKPSCGVCERLGLQCEGYLPPKVKKPVVRSERLLLPRPEEVSLAPIQAQPTEARPAIALPDRPFNGNAIPKLAPCMNFEVLDDEDSWYFSLFRDQVIHELSPYHGTSFWSQTLLRDSTIHQCIRHSILSIGAYARATLELHQEKPWDQHASHPWRSPSPYNRHLQAALEHNTKALHSLRSHLDMYGVDNRLTMAATLLFIVFQNMQGNFHRSGDLIRAGIKILKKMYTSTEAKPDSFSRYRWQKSQTKPRDEVDDMADIFARHSVSYVFVPFHHAKYAYHLLLTEDTDDDDSDFEEKKEIMRKASSRGTTDFSLNHELPWPRTVAVAQRSWDYLLPVLASFQSKTAWHNINPNITSDHFIVLDEQAALLARLRKYEAALDSLAAAMLCSDGYFSSTESRTLEFLQLQHMMAVVFVSCCTDPTEMAYDGFLHEFEMLLQRADNLVKSSPHNARSDKVGFTNEAGILQLLAFVGAKCRVSRIRQQAIALLRQYHWREGNWDGTSLAYGVEGVMRLEGQMVVSSPTQADWATTSFFVVPDISADVSLHPPAFSHSPSPEIVSATPLVPPSQSRYAWTNMFWDFDRRHITFEYSCVMRDEFGEFQKARWEMDESRIVDQWTYFSAPS